MYKLAKFTAKTIVIVVSLTALSAAVSAVSDYFGKEPLKITYVVSDMIDSGLSLLPEKLEVGAKNILTELEGRVSNITKNFIGRFDP
ncbi:MAG: hypothetical protein IJY93_09305 [Clostridia bacterium]|nr:hypothetical protein [Clostridia bacterium]